MSNIGFIGTGIMGRPMAGHLQAAGHQLYLCRHRTPPPEELVSSGAVECVSAKEVAEQADIVIIMVPDTPQVESTLFGEAGVGAGLSPGKLVIDMSSISPIETKAFAARINDLGCDYLDAPVSGGEVGAKSASLTIMVGGSETVFQKASPLFELMGKNITLVGENGAGQTCKVANQIIVALTIEAVGEALVFASKAGVDPARVRQALMGGFAGSKILEVHGERMINRTFDPGFRIGSAPERSEPRPVRRARPGCQPAEHGHRPGIVQRLRRGARSFRPDHGVGRPCRSRNRLDHHTLRRTPMPTIRATVDQLDQSSSRGQTRDHSLVMDRPEPKGGQNKGPMGGEALLLGLGGCFMSNLLAAARAREIAISNASLDIAGELADSPARYTAIHMKVSAQCGEPGELNKLSTIAERGCLVANTLRNAVDLTIECAD